MRVTDAQTGVVVVAVCLLTGTAVWWKLVTMQNHQQQHAQVLPHVHLADGRACWYESQGPQPEAHQARALTCTTSVVAP